MDILQATDARTSSPDDRVSMLSAVMLSALLVDAAVETFRSGSPVRWWALTLLLVYGLATAIAWARTSWTTKTSASLFVLMGTLAVTAWLPSGTHTGLRLLGLSTTTLLTAAAACGVAMAGAVLWCVPALSRPARWGIAAVAAYSVAAFVEGIARGTSLPALLHGESLWRAVPTILQGAAIGAFFVLPLALVASAITAGLRHPASGSRAQRIRQMCALSLSLTTVLAAIPLGDRLQLGAASASIATPSELPPGARLAALENSLRAIEDGERDSPRDRWDPDFVVSQVGLASSKLFEWVRDNTYWIPYRGVLRGPVGVLMDRMGNSLDRALLLATLLQRAGHTVRLAHGEYSEEQAGAMLPDLVALRPSQSIGPVIESAAVSSDIRGVAAQYRFMGTELEGTIRAGSDHLAQIAWEARHRVDDQVRRLARRVGRLSEPSQDFARRLDAATDALRDHWWVQERDGDAWIDYDVLTSRPGAPEMRASFREHLNPADLSPELYHGITIRVVTEQWADGDPVQTAALEFPIRLADVIGQTIVLRLWPTHWTKLSTSDGNQQQALRAMALHQHEWSASLLSGGTSLVSATLSDTAVTETAHVETLTAAWFEYEIRGPQQPSRTVRRTVFDLVGPAARAQRKWIGDVTDLARTTRSLSLMMVTEILPLGCQIAPEFVAHEYAQSVLANRDLLRSTLSPETLRGNSGKQAKAVPSQLYALALARFDWSTNADRVYVDRPGVLTRHIFLTPTPTNIVWRDAIDIVSNTVGVDLLSEDPFSLRLAQGVLDTNVEALLASGSGRAANTGEAFARADDWVTLTRDSPLAPLNLPEDVVRMIADDLGAGYVVVVPPRSTVAGSRTFTGWWRIDPSTGETIGLDDRGWGGAQTLAEYAATFEEAFLCEWSFCEALQEFVAVARDGADFGERWQGGGPHLSADRVASEPNCVMMAIAAGFAATLPMLVFQIHSSLVMRWLRAPRIVPEIPFGAGGRFPTPRQYARHLESGTYTLADGTKAVSIGNAWGAHGGSELVRFPGSVASRVNIEKNIPLSTQIHASIRAELDQAVARLEAASARELTARHSLPPSDGRFHAILTERDAARQAVKTLRESEDLAARQMNYWKDLKPVDDELAIAIAARDAAKSRYNSGFSFTVSAPDHLANTRALLEAEARMRALDGKWNDVALKAMTRDFSTPSVVRPPEGGVSPFAQSLGGMSGVGSSLPPPPLGQF